MLERDSHTNLSSGQSWPSKLSDRIEKSGYFRLLRVLEVFVIIFALVAFFQDYKQRSADRAVRIATLINQIAETSRHQDFAARSALGRTAQILADQGVSLADMPLRLASMNEMDLRGADFFGADLSEAGLIKSVLVGADLRYSNLVRTNFSFADLSNARFDGADISGADFSSATLDGSNLSMACIEPTTPPTLPDGVSLQHVTCPKYSLGAEGVLE